MWRKLITALSVLLIGVSFVFLPGCQSKSQSCAMCTSAAINTRGVGGDGTLGTEGGFLVGRETGQKYTSREAASSQQKLYTVACQCSQQ
jgi:hypothetical protein